MKAKKILLGSAMALASAATLASCGGNSGLSVCLASTPDHVDPALNSAVDGASYAVHLFGGLVRYVPAEDGKTVKLAADLAKELPEPVKEGDKVSYTFTLKDDIKFSDGTPIEPSDFVKSWNRAASYTPTYDDPEGTIDEETGKTKQISAAEGALDADYCYMFEVIDGYDSLDDNAASLTADSYKNFLNLTADDENNTLKVVLPVDVPYFYELCAFPAYMVLKDADKLPADGSWAKDPSQFVGSGAYTLKSFEKDVKMVIEKNPNYWDAENVKTEKINFVFSDDSSAMLAQYNSGELQLIDDLDAETVTTYQKTADYHSIGQLGTYYISWNVNGDTFRDFPAFTEPQKAEIRNAISLLIDRKTIVTNVTKMGQTPSTGFVGAGLSDPAGGEFVDHNGVNGDGKGYCGDANNYAANKATAIETLRKYFTYNEVTKKFEHFPTIEYLYNTNSGHEAVAVAVQAQFREVGITVTARNQDWAQFLNTRKDGNYSVARNGWLADYNDPISFLDLWTTASGNNDCQLGKGDHANYAGYEIDLTGIGSYTKLTGTWADTYDVVIAAIKSETNKEVRYKLMHKAEDLLMSTGCINPIYNYVDNWLQAGSLNNVYVSPLGFKYFTWATTGAAA